MDGLLLIDKPAGWTSHDVVARVRKLARTRKVGHTGTLDPDATGLLPITIGHCTKLAQYLILDQKTYAFELELGSQTDTDDASGQVIASASWSHVTPQALEQALDAFRGVIMQQPPRYSALKIEGKRAYDLARQGVDFELAARQVQILSLQLERVELPRAWLMMRCTSGTYVRSLVRDLGAALGTCAHTTQIRRLAVGALSIERAVTLESLSGPEDLAPHLLSAAQMMASLPAQRVSEQERRAITFGQEIQAAQPYALDEPVALLDAQGQLIAIAARCSDAPTLRPRRVLIAAS